MYHLNNIKKYILRTNLQLENFEYNKKINVDESCLLIIKARFDKLGIIFMIILSGFGILSYVGRQTDIYSIIIEFVGSKTCIHVMSGACPSFGWVGY